MFVFLYTADGDKGGGEGGDPDVVVAGGGRGVQRRADCVAAARGRRVIAKPNPLQNPPRGYATGYARGGLLLVSFTYSVFSIQYKTSILRRPSALVYPQ